MKRATTPILTILLLCLTISSATAQKPLSYRDGYIELDQGNFHNAFVTFQRLAEQGDARSQNELGFMHLVGFKGKQDFKAAAEWFRRAAEQGLARAQFNLGELYETGRGVPKSNVHALQWFWIAALMARREQRRDLAKSKISILERPLTSVARNQARDQACIWLQNAKNRLKLSVSVLTVCANG
jgi:TPR repeat protein